MFISKWLDKPLGIENPPRFTSKTEAITAARKLMARGTEGMVEVNEYTGPMSARGTAYQIRKLGDVIVEKKWINGKWEEHQVFTREARKTFR